MSIQIAMYDSHSGYGCQYDRVLMIIRGDKVYALENSGSYYGYNYEVNMNQLFILKQRPNLTVLET